MNERILAGRYCLQNAVGGRADLFHAVDESLQRKVAVKRLQETMPGTSRQHWEQEIAKAAGLHDPHLLAIYDVVVEEDCFYLITEDIEGDILARWMRKRAPLTPEVTVDIMRQLISAVVQAEKNGLREISIDANSVLVSREGFVKVIEYGPLLGRNHKRQNHQELLRTAGELLYEMLTGSAYSDFLPTREVVEEIHRALMQVKVEHHWLPDRMEQMVQRALGLLEGRTYLSIQDLYKDLKAVHHALGQLVEATPTPKQQTAVETTEIPPRLGRVKESMKTAAQGSVNKVAQLRNMEIVKKITEQNKPKQTKRTPLTILWAVLALVVVSGGLWYMLGDERSSAQTNAAQNAGQSVQMPNLINKTDEQALQILSDKGIPKDQILWVYRPADDTSTQGKIYMQSIDPNKSVTVGGSKIILTVNGSDGGALEAQSGDGSQDGGNANQAVVQGTVPNVRGMSVDQAGALLVKAGYHYDFRVVSGGDTPSGTVFKQDPDAGGQVASGTHIHLLVSQ
ncbi:MAG: PASTA domain-containing protein [Tumebacillaceae bacterium]